MADRNGNRIPRSQRSGSRVPRLGHYIIVTDTEETEKNYLEGLKRSLSANLQHQLLIKVIRKVPTKDLINTALQAGSENPQYARLWIVFDRDEVKDYDLIIEEAVKKEIRVGWSNPCIEIWLHAYLGEMKFALNSSKCCEQFEATFFRKTEHRYDKTDPDIYQTLFQIGDEARAIERAKKKYNEHHDDGKRKPSEMNPATTLYELIDEIRCKCR